MDQNFLSASQEQAQRSAARRAAQGSGGSIDIGNVADRFLSAMLGGAVAGLPGLIGGAVSTPKEVVIRDRGSSNSSISPQAAIGGSDIARGMIPSGGSSQAAEDNTITDTTITEGSNGEDTWLDDNTIEYTYKEGDTFGQVIKDLGLMTDNGLWGNNGDVKYYEKQLREQGWNGGNIPIGMKIRLRRRPAVQYDMYGNRIK